MDIKQPFPNNSDKNEGNKLNKEEE